MALVDNGTSRLRHPRSVLRAHVLSCCLAIPVLGCESKEVIAAWSCPRITKAQSERIANSAGAAGRIGATSSAGSTSFAGDSSYAGHAGAVRNTTSSAGTTNSAGTNAGKGGEANELPPFPWSTSFEDGFCDYADDGGFCFATGDGSFEVVAEPVRSGKYAAAFRVRTEESSQVRCVRQGTLPTESYYGAWYYVPAVARNDGVWNLIHFQGGESPRDLLHGLWDVSLVNDDNGDLRLVVYDFLRKRVPPLANAPSVPIGNWFHIQVYLKRAADDTGELAVFQDGVELLRLTDLSTDDSQWGQWYVGNLADKLEPPESTLYVDDVTISQTP